MDDAAAPMWAIATIGGPTAQRSGAFCVRQVAADDKRETAVMARLILTEWLIAKGYLQEEPRR
jgi:hypothetical protein